MDIQEVLSAMQPMVLPAISFVAATALSTLFSYCRDKKLQEKIAELQEKNRTSSELLARQSDAIGIVLSQQQHGQRLVMERQVEAADRAWREVLALRDLSSSCAIIDDVLLPEERDVDAMIRVGGVEADEVDRYIRNYIERDDLEEVRLYLGEQLWADFYALRAFSIRCLYFYQQCVFEGRFVNWSDDSGLQQILQWAIEDSDEVAELLGLKLGFVRTSQERLEAKVVKSLS